jgi:hypothetical protein
MCAPLSMRSGASVFAVCQFCSTAHVRNDIGVEEVGKSAELLKDFSALQLGSKGYYIFPNGDGRRFELIGRVRVGWERGYWDEWYVIFENNTYGWLAEAQGYYYVSFPVDPKSIDIGEELTVGQIISYDGKDFSVSDFKEASILFSAGELPFKAIGGETYKSADCIAVDGSFMTISRQENQEREVYVGTVHSFTELNFEFLHELEGWNI